MSIGIASSSDSVIKWSTEGWSIEPSLEKSGQSTVLLECHVNETARQAIKIINVGKTEALYFEIIRCSKNSSFEKRIRLLKPVFFVDHRKGSVLPGGSFQINITFKSGESGIFKETWEIQAFHFSTKTKAICVALNGLATETDETVAKEQKRIEMVLTHRIAQKVASQLVENLTLQASVMNKEPKFLPMSWKRTPHQKFLCFKIYASSPYQIVYSLLADFIENTNDVRAVLRAAFGLVETNDKDKHEMSRNEKKTQSKSKKRASGSRDGKLKDQGGKKEISRKMSEECTEKYHHEHIMETTSKKYKQLLLLQPHCISMI
ncbi:uncharacterized protein LOC111086600 isoform X2 [Limulus polyphemus]|uniref:Uncharacterized protein LOC111086600 isoform X2 n=1 Tax=Limulus polyphemus TaxID=6850 RepID=A0ABM1SQ89_LIMPO|nr:uncharacterized protein LOC111086600 isoform X2 [Limulus polyphemus]